MTKQTEPAQPDDSSISRRDLALAGLLGAATLGSSFGEAAETAGKSSAPGLEFVFELNARLGKPMEFGSAEVSHTAMPFSTARSSGLLGRVLPGGNDTQRIHEGGRTEILARYLLQADDGAIVQVVNPGVRRASPEIMKRLVAGEIVDPGLYYFRTTPTFETTGAARQWLKSVFVCVGIRKPDAVALRFYALL